MSTENDPLRKIINSSTQLYPEVDLEAAIMASVRKEAALRQRVRRLRRHGTLFMIIFLLLLALALWYTQVGYSHPAYTAPETGFGFAGLFLLLLFFQLEVSWRRFRPMV